MKRLIERLAKKRRTVPMLAISTIPVSKQRHLEKLERKKKKITTNRSKCHRELHKSLFAKFMATF